MQGKVVVITGATWGIGEVAAQRLAGMGARIVLVARDKIRGEAALTRSRSYGTNSSHSIHYGNLSRISEMKRLAVEIAAAEPRIGPHQQCGRHVRLASDDRGESGTHFRYQSTVQAISPEIGAETIAYLASSPDVGNRGLARIHRRRSAVESGSRPISTPHNEPTAGNAAPHGLLWGSNSPDRSCIWLLFLVSVEFEGN
jgi:hypothetical protein